VNGTEAVIDPGTDTITVENPSRFRSNDFVDGAIVTEPEFNVITPSSKNESLQTDVKPVKIALKDYHMPVIPYEDGIIMPFLALQNSLGAIAEGEDEIEALGALGAKTECAVQAGALFKDILALCLQCILDIQNEIAILAQCGGGHHGIFAADAGQRGEGAVFTGEEDHALGLEIHLLQLFGENNALIFQNFQIFFAKLLSFRIKKTH
jgi:hypothetical protein